MLILLIIMMIIGGCNRIPQLIQANETHDFMPDGELITKNASEIVLTLDDIGEGWLLHNKGWDQPNRFFVIFFSKESAGVISDHRYVLNNFVITFDSSTEAKSEFNEMKTHAIQSKIGMENIDMGDDAYLTKDKIGGGIVLRYKNIIATVSFSDVNEDYDKIKVDELIEYSRLLKNKIVNPKFEEKIIMKNASELVLDLSDIGNDWILENSYQTENGGYVTVFRSKESGGVISDGRYGLSSTVNTFPTENDAKIFFKEHSSMIERSLRTYIGDESIIYYEPALGVVLFRENNIVIKINYDDVFENLNESKLVNYAKIIEIKIVDT